MVVGGSRGEMGSYCSMDMEFADEKFPEICYTIVLIVSNVLFYVFFYHN